MSKDKEIAKKDTALKKTDNSVEMTQDLPVYIPRADIFENKQNITVYADMPGVDDKNIDITLEDDILTIIGTQNQDFPDGMELAYHGYRPGIYKRSFTLGVAVDREKINAKINNGVLTLVLPKAEEAKPKKITVTAG